VTTLPPEIRFLTRGWERGMGAMFRRDLDGRILVFVYQRPASHLFHTFCSPPLRLLALADDGSPLFDAVIPPNRMVPLPASRLVVECDPERSLSQNDLAEIAAITPIGQRIPVGKGARPWTG
jgi:hypothetical protein